MTDPSQSRVKSCFGLFKRRNNPSTVDMTSQKQVKRLLQQKHLDVIDSHGNPQKVLWIPFDAIDELHATWNEKSITAILPNVDTKSLLSFASRAKRLWALLVYINRLKWLESFWDADFDDALFPICTEHRTWQVNSRKTGRSVTIPVDTDIADDETVFDSIGSQQWQFFAPIFKQGNTAEEFEVTCRMPFIRNIPTGTQQTNFSIVDQVVMHQKHWDLSSNDDLSGVQIGSMVDEHGHPYVAVKQLRSAVLGHSEFDQESSILAHFGKMNHRHFIRLIARYTQGNLHFFVFPWARGGNLRKLWNTQPNLTTAPVGPEYCIDYIRWIFEQLLGLSEAIEKLHQDDNDAFGLLGRHGDLKPENILCFCSTDLNAGDLPTGVTLVIADAGLGRLHQKATDLRADRTGTQAGTDAYKPPEVETRKDDPRSRRYDIWSMGCPYLEFIIWILYGNEGLNSFHDHLKQSAESSTFYKLDPPKPSLKTEVQDWIDWIKNDPRCAPTTPGPPTAIGRLITLIEEKLLVVNLGSQTTEGTHSSLVNNGPTAMEPVAITIRAPTIDLTPMPRIRATAKEMRTELQKIVEAAKLRDRSSLVWINWDGMGEAATRGLPIAISRLSSTSHSNIAVANESSTTSVNQISEFKDTWNYEVDYDIARKVVSGSLARENQEHNVSSLCQQCQRLEIWSKRHRFSDTLANLEARSTSCGLCRLLSGSVSNLAPQSQETITFARTESGLSLVSGESIWDPRLSLCTTSESEILQSSEIQPGFPHRLIAGGTTHAELMSQWISDCNQDHSCTNYSDFSPTRLLYLGEKDCRRVKLVTTEKAQKPIEYVALSHRWGPSDHIPPANIQFAATTKDNLDEIQSLDGITADVLPKTFQDAITITRKLKVLYLWIDSLCILQKTGIGDDRKHKEDWAKESLLMEKVFSSAYFTIAASCAQHRFDGFLKERPQRDFITMTASDGNIFHVCQVIDNFALHVEDGELNKRGWVLQERALSRRTLHFTETQTYWECGDGIRCETFMKTRNHKAAFLGDSHFPRSVEAFKHGRKIQHYQDLYERYSSLGLSNIVDRPIAIAGLEQRLMAALESTGGYGIFSSNFHRGLLWHRDHRCPSLTKIEFDESSRVPSWSWMALAGTIEYMNVPMGRVNWNKNVICPFKPPEPQSSNPYEAQRPIEFQAPVISLKGERPRSLRQDDPSQKLDEHLKFVVIGSDKAENGQATKHYAILLSPVYKDGRHKFYKRAGAAYLTEAEICEAEVNDETDTETIR